MNSTALEAKLAYARAEWSKGKDTGELVFKCKNRPKLYDRCTWTKLMVPITDLFVKWPMGMGGRKWAKGSVNDIGEMMRGHTFDPIWSVFAIKDRHGRLNIDDGCHRAVIHYLAGAKLIEAYIGVLKL